MFLWWELRQISIKEFRFLIPTEVKLFKQIWNDEYILGFDLGNFWNRDKIITIPCKKHGYLNYCLSLPSPSPLLDKDKATFASSIWPKAFLLTSFWYVGQYILLWCCAIAPPGAQHCFNRSDPLTNIELSSLRIKDQEKMDYL